MEDVAGVVHDDEEDTGVGADAVRDAVVDLLDGGGGEDGAADGGAENAIADEAGGVVLVWGVEGGRGRSTLRMLVHDRRRLRRREQPCRLRARGGR